MAHALRAFAGLVRFAHSALARQNVPLARFVILAMQAEFDSPFPPAKIKKAGLQLVLPGSCWWRRGESNSGPYYIFCKALQA